MTTVMQMAVLIIFRTVSLFFLYSSTLMSFWALWPFVSRKGRESKLIIFLRLLSTNVI